MLRMTNNSCQWSVARKSRILPKNLYPSISSDFDAEGRGVTFIVAETAAREVMMALALEGSSCG